MKGREGYIELVLLDNFGQMRWCSLARQNGCRHHTARAGCLRPPACNAVRRPFLMRGLVLCNTCFGKSLSACSWFGRPLVLVVKAIPRYCGVFWLFSLLLAAGVRSMALFGQARALAVP
ncbi:MAG: hypothetical protein ACLUVV_03660 [Christensenellales bacterium]